MPTGNQAKERGRARVLLYYWKSGNAPSGDARAVKGVDSKFGSSTSESCVGSSPTRRDFLKPCADSMHTFAHGCTGCCCCCIAHGMQSCSPAHVFRGPNDMTAAALTPLLLPPKFTGEPSNVL